jgi:hypothetical protein
MPMLGLAFAISTTLGGSAADGEDENPHRGTTAGGAAGRAGRQQRLARVAVMAHEKVP